MGNDILGQVLGSVLGRGGQAGSMGGGGLGSVLGGMMGRGQGGAMGMGRSGRGSALGGQGGALIAMLLPLAMQWVQRNGGLGGVLERFKQKGYSQQAASWVSTGANDDLPAHAIYDVVGHEELSRLSQQLGVDSEEVSQGMAQIMPEMVNQLTPDGNVPDDSDVVLGRGITSLEQMLMDADRVR
ncbi:MAG TPA: YidB family protein [Polaromonas sp.]|uniref:YidB family protein n=1 Tax=Polaromonas sp. TaxID=1869339 RepID=UPI002D597006|nr:YidB family protein [Polaromonas sp.]HYW55464.1 YidB family protein [Polaromonas sp.]